MRAGSVDRVSGSNACVSFLFTTQSTWFCLEQKLRLKLRFEIRGGSVILSKVSRDYDLGQCRENLHLVSLIAIQMVVSTLY